MEFGKYLKNARTECSLTVRKLSELSGVSQSYLTNIENGKRGIPSLEMLKRISDHLYPADTYASLLDAAGYEELAKAVKWQELLDDFSPIDDGDEGKGVRGLRDQVKFLEHVTDIQTFLEHNYEPDNELKSEEFTSLSISPKYNGHLLTDQDRQRILDMLKALFPQYTTKGE
jgi:transcriptional regulator with XRE-family HTH domain